MDIESKHYRLRTASTLPGRVEIHRKATGATTTVRADKLPGLRALAAMHEKEFNKILAGFI